MLGSIAGDIAGSTFEFMPTDSKRFELFAPGSAPTDDSLLTLAVAKWLLDDDDLVEMFKQAVADRPGAGWGSMFREWAAADDPRPYQSFGNGSAMRVAPVGFAFETLDATLAAAERSASVTHDHPEGIKGAQAVAAAIFMARRGADKATIRQAITGRFGYRLDRSLTQVREYHIFDETCQGSIPEAIIAFLDSEDFEDAVRSAVSLGGDADTQACIAGGIAQAFYGGMPSEIRKQTLDHLEPTQQETVLRFEGRFGCG